MALPPSVFRGVGLKQKAIRFSENAKRILNDESGLSFEDDVFAAVKDTDLMVVITEWNEFAQLDLEQVRDLMKQPAIVDGSNIYDPKKAQALGYKYTVVGRKDAKR